LTEIEKCLFNDAINYEHHIVSVVE
jgi:hypothetical protein